MPAVFFLGILLSCGTSAPKPYVSGLTVGSVQLDGSATVAGTALRLTTPLYALGTDPEGSPVLLVWLSSSANVCNLLATGSQAAESDILALNVVQLDSYANRVVPRPGVDAQIVGNDAQQNGSGSYAGVEAFVLDNSCNQALSQNQSVAIGGDVALLGWDGLGAPLYMSFHAIVGAQSDVISGRFAAVYCAALGQTAQSAPNACAPATP